MFGRKDDDDSSEDCRSSKYARENGATGYNYKNKLAYETRPAHIKTVSFPFPFQTQIYLVWITDVNNIQGAKI